MELYVKRVCAVALDRAFENDLALVDVDIVLLFKFFCNFL